VSLFLFALCGLALLAYGIGTTLLLVRWLFP